MFYLRSGQENHDVEDEDGDADEVMKLDFWSLLCNNVKVVIFIIIYSQNVFVSFFLIYLFKFLSVLFSFSFQKTVEEMIKDLKDEEISELKRYGVGKQC